MSKRTSILWAAGLLGIVLIVGIAAAIKLGASPVSAAPQVGTTYTCAPDLVVSANVRVVAHCATGFNTGTTLIYWFAYPTSDSGNASRMLSLFETAKATGSTITFYFDTADLSGAAYGCNNTDCRAIWAATSHAVSGHTLKHLLAAAAIALLAAMLARRRPIAAAATT